MFDENAQLHTLEGVAAATLLLMVIIYAIDATSITPLTASTANLHIESEVQMLGQDMLNTLDYAEPRNNSELKNFIINWNGNQYVWSGNAYDSGGEKLDNNITIIKIFNNTLIKQGIAHNMEVIYLEEVDNFTRPSSPAIMIYNGEASNNGVIVSRKIVLHDTDNTNSANPIKDIDTSTNLYNIVDIRLILWRT